MAPSLSLSTAFRKRIQSRLRPSKLGRRSFRMVVLYEAFCEAFDPRAGVEDIRSCIFSGLKRVGDDALIGLPEHWWNTYIRLVLCGERPHDALENELLEVTEKLAIDLLEPRIWHDLFRICLFSGLFRVGLVARKKASHAYQSIDIDESSDVVSISLALSQFLESGDAVGATHALERLSKLGLSDDDLAQGAWFRDLLCSGEVRPLIFDQQDDSPECQTLRAVSGKTVAIVGPVPSSTMNGTEIDKQDVVLKFNYRGGEQGCDPDTQGRRVDVAYYNIDQAKYIAKHGGDEFPGKLSFPVCIKSKGLRALARKAPNARSIKSPQWLLFDSEFHAGTNATLDIIRFSPGAVKVFNSDLMLTAGRYKGYWRPGTKEVNYCLSFGKTHDPVMQYNYLYLLWSKGIVSGDERFLEIMSSGLGKYIEDLQEVHGLKGKVTLLEG